ncbi:MAG: CvpA family protein [Candidatus Limnocylindrales bacterium]|jgi:uncharacterized membrane protein required for colicin V production
MDIVGAIRSAPLVDLAIFVGLFGAFVAGALQGAIRRILGIVSMVFAFLLAANLRDPVGDYLADHWQQFPSGYNHLIAFIGLFCVLWIAFSVLIQGFYKRTELSATHPVIDDVVGGLLGLLEGFILLTIAIIIFGSYAMPDPFSGEVQQLRWAHDLVMQQSNIAGALRDNIVPALVHLMSPLLPADLVAAFP